MEEGKEKGRRGGEEEMVRGGGLGVGRRGERTMRWRGKGG